LTGTDPGSSVVDVNKVDTQASARKGLDWAQARVLDTPLHPDTEQFYRYEQADCDD